MLFMFVLNNICTLCFINRETCWIVFLILCLLQQIKLLSSFSSNSNVEIGLYHLSSTKMTNMDIIYPRVRDVFTLRKTNFLGHFDCCRLSRDSPKAFGMLRHFSWFFSKRCQSIILTGKRIKSIINPKMTTFTTQLLFKTMFLAFARAMTYKTS